jgi:hypothetical protein
MKKRDNYLTYSLKEVVQLHFLGLQMGMPFLDHQLENFYAVKQCGV